MKNTELKFENDDKTKSIVTRRDGNKYLLEWFDSTNFENIKPVKQVYGYIFDEDGKLLLVNPKTTWRLSGGEPEDDDKNFEETLIRETDEEADVEIKDIAPLGYLKITSINNDDGLHYALRYVARIERINEQTEDKAIGDIGERIFIEPEKFSDYCDWGEMGEFMLKQAIEKLQEKKCQPKYTQNN